MSRPRVRLGVVGVGDFGARHARIAREVAEVDLVAVADRDVQRRSDVAKQLAVAGCRDADELLNRYDVDGLVIATPQAAHLADITTAVEAGVDVLVEKPVVASTDEVAALLRLAGTHPDRLVVPAHVGRFLPAVATLRTRLSGVRVHAVRAIRVVPTERLVLHGGEHPALVAMIHDLDLVRAFVPSELAHVSSEQHWIDIYRPHPQVVAATLRFEDGTVATVENHWTLPHSRQYIDARLEVITAKETAHVTVPGGSLRVVTSGGDELPDVDLETYVGGVPAGALATQLRCFARCVASRDPGNVVTLEDAVWSTRVADQIAKQAPPQ